MRAYEFLATAKNGFIEIPDEYKDEIASSIRVIVLSGEERKKSDLFPRLGLDMRGFEFNREELNER